MITIRAPRATLDAWDAALRSGEYKQGKNTLRTQKGTYCCLGVLQMVLDGDVEKTGTGSESLPAPTNQWLAAHGIEFLDSSDNRVRVPYLPDFACSAARANDGYGNTGENSYTFIQIADAIKNCSEATS